MMMHKALGPVLALCCAAACSQGEPAIDPGAGDDLTAIPAAPEVAGGCAHDVCDEGVALDATCSPCAAAVCQQDPECCATAWDQLCVFEAEDLCGEDCTSCSHGLCVEGEALDPIQDGQQRHGFPVASRRFHLHRVERHATGDPSEREQIAEHAGRGTGSGNELHDPSGARRLLAETPERLFVARRDARDPVADGAGTHKAARRGRLPQE